MTGFDRRAFLKMAGGFAAGGWPQTADPDRLPVDDGYRGIWYSNQPSHDEFVYKYSGGFATYPQQHIPIAIYSKEARRTFFCYGGVAKGGRELLHKVSYYDHATATVPRPRILLNKKTEDAHDNPTLSLDDEGYVWIYSNAHGAGRPSYVHRGRKPYEIDSFERVLTTNFSYGQPWHLSGRGFLFLHTRYTRGRRFLFWMSSRDGRTWSEPSPLAQVAQGHYQISGPTADGRRLATAFNYHPEQGGLNARTNLYYLETDDFGRTWRAADGQEVRTPLTDIRNPALVRDYESEKRLVYLKDLQFDARGRPIILYLTSGGYASGPKSGPRIWHTARLTDRGWEIHPAFESDHNYDFGSLYVEPDGWRVIAPTGPGPQAHTTGGEMALWTSGDLGRTWRRTRELTRNSLRNHTYARRPVNAHPDFYALWADGDTKRRSESHLYFTNRACDRVWRLPPTMSADTARPQPIE